MDTLNFNDIASAALMAVSSVSSKEAVLKAAGGSGMDGTVMDPSLTPGAEAKDSLLASWPFVAGISAGVLVVSIALGAFLARRKIKKGIDLYED